MEGGRKVKIPYRPRKIFRPYHRRKERYALIVAHRRAGKTVAVINDCIRKCTEIRRTFPPPQVAFISPTYRMAKRNAWQYVCHYAGVIPGVELKVGELMAVFPNGARLMLAGSDNPDRLRGMYLDHAALDEFADQPPMVWDAIIRPALADYNGGATFIGTPKGRNHFYRLFMQAQENPDWYVSVLRASETGIIPEEELESIRRSMTPAMYAQEFECSFDAEIEGAYYAQLLTQAEREGRITNVPHDPAAEVFAAWDLGIDDMTAIWVGQFVGQEIHLIDFIQDNGHGLDYYLDLLAARPYPVHKHILPHDAEARELGTGARRTDFFMSRGALYYVAPRLPVADGINAVRVAFPRMWFDARKCAEGLDSLRMYAAQKDKLGNPGQPGPKWATHAADALRYAIVGQGLLSARRDVGEYRWRRRIAV